MKPQCTITGSIFLLVGRVAFALIFVLAGFDKIAHFDMYVAGLAAKGVAMAHIVMIIAIVFELGGGLLVLLGWYTRFGAILLFLFIIPVSYVYHSFWVMSGQDMVINMQHFFKNLSMLGATLYIMVAGAGYISIDGWRCRKHCCHSKPDSNVPLNG